MSVSRYDSPRQKALEIYRIKQELAYLEGKKKRPELSLSDKVVVFIGSVLITAVCAFVAYYITFGWIIDLMY